MKEEEKKKINVRRRMEVSVRRGKEDEGYGKISEVSEERVVDREKKE